MRTPRSRAWRSEESTAEAASYLREMAATHTDRTGAAFRRFGQWLARAYDVYVDDESVARMRALDRRHSLLFLFSHRSYLDGTLVPEVVAAAADLGAVHVRRGEPELLPDGLAREPVGRHLHPAQHRRPAALPLGAPLLHRPARRATGPTWRGRSRAAGPAPASCGRRRSASCGTSPTRSSDADGADALLVPVSIVYDQLHEVVDDDHEARARKKRPEDLRWLYTVRPRAAATGSVAPTWTSVSRSRSRERLAELQRRRGGGAVRRRADRARVVPPASTGPPRSPPPPSSAWRSSARTVRCPWRGAGDGGPARRLPRRARLAGRRGVQPHATARRSGARCRSWWSPAC